jgi:hypothetical protein
MSREITLTKGCVAIVDDEDYEWLTVGNKWGAGGHVGNLYARRTIWLDKTSCRVEFMHRLILPTEHQVDHINRNTLDNRRSNLRVATARQNAANRKVRSDNKSGYRGVHTLGKGPNPFQAVISINGANTHLGVFPTAQDAARAYDHAAIEHYGEFASLNFPEEQYA